ncbi:hypothetical protein [Nostoc sp. MG11]|uniref:hypothetical protein n=1 Tax=Nostoc sp. MG11 TaxID=2721166 RepID=UPI001D001DDF|nr:hypothetical protein [Nostoc sp. MG11]
MNSDKNRVAPKVWLITGCSTGFGRALAEGVDIAKTLLAKYILILKSLIIP